MLLQASFYKGQNRKDKPRGRHHGLTQQKRQEIKEAFDLFDTDGSGTEIISCHLCFRYVWYFPFHLFVLFVAVFSRHY